MGLENDIKLVIQQVRKISAEFIPGFLTPKEQADLKFAKNENELTGEFQLFGTVIEHTVSPGTWQVTHPGTQVAKVDELTRVTLYDMDEKKRERKEPVEVSCELVPSDGYGQLKGEVEKKAESMYKISYCPRRKGTHYLHIRVEDTEVSRSPFTVTVFTTTPISSIKHLYLLDNSVHQGLSLCFQMMLPYPHRH